MKHNPRPEVGMGATIIMYSDKHAATIIDVHPNGKRIVIQEDIATRTDINGMSDSQTYTYAPNSDGEKHVVSLRKDGTWRISRSKTQIGIGYRREYYDYSF